ncbi:hypothetical protein Nepgr_007106 [Nepenthes gracilis]|uniref:Uncharacterized protein n=1 Tax=Nepenthes gracilis TaxID=150966 RepID=A0AAD3XI76_NEPGR|nr:hypothetical protein Nepgr_007106 [Nepenthes gracilis]
MRKLCRRGTVHPSPPVISDHLAYLPAAILTLTAALTAEDKEVLAYLISCSGNITTNSANNPKNIAAAGKKTAKEGDHPPSFGCNCFRCYMSYWVRWDSSPNRQLIHEIIDAFEDGLAQNIKKSTRRERKKKGFSGSDLDGEIKRATATELNLGEDEATQSESVAESSDGEGGGGEGEGRCGGGAGGDVEKGSVRKFMSFIGERIWGIWG